MPQIRVIDYQKRETKKNRDNLNINKSNNSLKNYFFSKLKISNKYFFSFYNFLYGLKQEIKIQKNLNLKAELLLENEKPDLLVLLNDQRVDLELFLITASKRKNIATVLLNVFWIGDIYQAAQLQHFRQIKGIVNREPDWLIAIAKFIFPKTVINYGGSNIMFSHPFKNLIGLYYGIKPSTPLNRGQYVDLVIITSQNQKKVFEKNGIKNSKLVLAGEPQNDKLFHLRKKKDAIIKSLYKDLIINNSANIITIASSNPGFIPKKKDKDYHRIIKHLLDIHPTIFIFFKPHPQEEMDFDYLENISSRVKVINNQIDEIIMCSKLFITRGSSTLIKAVLLGVPSISFDFHHENIGKRYPYSASVEQSNNLLEIKEKAESLLFNSNKRGQVINQQRKAIDEYAIFDGKCIDRIINTLIKV